MYHAEYR